MSEIPATPSPSTYRLIKRGSWQKKDSSRAVSVLGLRFSSSRATPSACAVSPRRASEPVLQSLVRTSRLKPCAKCACARIELQDWPRAARTSDEWPFSGQHGNASHRLPNAVDATAVLRNCNTCISDLPCAGLGTELQNQFVDLAQSSRADRMPFRL